jgi:hypothetical protein
LDRLHRSHRGGDSPGECCDVAGPAAVGAAADPHFPAENKLAYPSELAKEARKQGIDVPIFTCWTREIRGNHEPALQGVFDSCNFNPGFNIERIAGDMRRLHQQQPGMPMMTSELQGGWFTRLPDE